MNLIGLSISDQSRALFRALEETTTVVIEQKAFCGSTEMTHVWKEAFHSAVLYNISSSVSTQKIVKYINERQYDDSINKSI